MCNWLACFHCFLTEVFQRPARFAKQRASDYRVNRWVVSMSRRQACGQRRIACSASLHWFFEKMALLNSSSRRCSTWGAIRYPSTSTT